jgi:excisionase family DNA binding protein
MTALLTAAEVAALLRVPTSWIYAQTRTGRIPHLRIGRYCRYRQDAIEDWVTSLERGPTPRRKQQPPGGPPNTNPHKQAE